MPKALSYLLISGFIHLAGFVSLLFFQPFNAHIKPFLIIIFALFSAHFIWIRFLQKKGVLGKNKPALIGFILLFSLIFRGLLLTTTPSLSDDIYRYEWDGIIQEAGFNPYQYAPEDESLAHFRHDNHSKINYPDIKTIYPPLSQMVFRLGVKLSDGIGIHRFLFLLFDVFCLLTIIWLLVLKKRSVLWATIYGWSPLVVVEFSSSGHLDSLMMFLVLGSILFFEMKKNNWGHFTLGLSVLAKWVSLVFVPWILFRKKFSAMMLFGLVVFLGVIPLLQGSSGGLGTFFYHWVFNPSIYGLLKAETSDPLFVRLIIGGFLLGWSFVWAKKTQNDPLKYGMGIFLVLLLGSPVVHPWYVVWLVPFLCFYPIWGVLLWTATVNLSYLVLVNYISRGVWELSWWVPIVEYVPVYALLLVEGIRRKKKELQYIPNQSKKKLAPPKYVSVIIPAVNEEKSIAKVIEEIPKKLVKEIIVVNNSSTDKTAEVARKAGAHVVNENKMGYGRTVLKGMANVSKKCDTIVILDGDHSDYPADLNELMEPIKNNQADMVIGGRTKKALPGSLTPHQRFGNWLTCSLIKFLYGWEYTDMGPFRVIRKSTLDSFNMKDKNFGWNVEMQVKALQRGCRVVEIPVRYRPRIGKSKISGTIKGTFMAGTVILYSIYRYGWSKSN